MEAIHATFELLGGQPVAALARAAPLLDRAEGRPLVVAAVAAAPALAVVGHLEASVAVAQRGLEARLALGPQEALDDAGIHVVTQALALSESGRLTEAAELCRAGAAASADAGSATGEAWFNLLGGRVALLEGQLVAAGRAFGEAATLFGDLDQPGNRRWALAGVLLAAAFAGDAERTKAAAEAMESVPSMGLLLMEPDIERAAAWALMAGEPASARDRLHAAVALAHDAGAVVLEAAAWHDLARIGDAATVSSAADALSSIAREVDGALVPARAAHAAALAAGDAAALSKVAATFESMGALLFAAEAEAAAARVLQRAGRAREASRRAIRSRSLAARCEGARTPALLSGAAAAALTNREREIARLAAIGQSNREIAAGLVVSVRTVENHLQRTYEKLGVRSRAELAAALDGQVE
jgi:DNA-binding CsgD family transcriptional regulator